MKFDQIMSRLHTDFLVFLLILNLQYLNWVPIYDILIYYKTFMTLIIAYIFIGNSGK